MSYKGKIIINLFVYFLILCVSGIIKSNIILDYIPKDINSIAKISSYTSISISSIFSSLTLVAILFIIIFSNLVFDWEIEEKIIINSFNSIIYILMILEILKIEIAFLFLPELLKDMNFSKDFISDILKSNWKGIENYMNYIIIITASSIYSYEIYLNNKQKKYIAIIIFLIITFCSIMSSIKIRDTFLL